MPDEREPTADEMAVWHIMQLAEQGRFEYIIAQMIASAVLSSDGNSAILFDIRNKIEESTLNLLMEAEPIWDGLLPGPGTRPLGFDYTKLIVVNEEEWFKLERDSNMFKMIFDIIAEDILDEERFERITNRLIQNGYVIEHGPDEKPSEANSSADPYKYRMSIIVNPNIRSDYPVGWEVRPMRDVNATSALDIAEYAAKQMEAVDDVGDWPRDELAALIVHAQTGNRFLMTYDEANLITKLDEVKGCCEDSKTPVEIDFDDIFQQLSDTISSRAHELETLQRSS